MNYISYVGLQTTKVESSTDKMILDYCQIIGLPFDQLVIKRRNGLYVEYRQILMTLLMANYPVTCLQVGQMFNKDHSTVVYSQKVCRDRFEVEGGFRTKYLEILTQLSTKSGRILRSFKPFEERNITFKPQNYEAFIN